MATNESRLRKETLPINKLDHFQVLLHWQDLAILRHNDPTDREAEYRLLVQIGGLYMRNGRYGPAVRSFKQALRCARRLREPRRTAGVLLALAETYLAWDDAPAALPHYEEAYLLAQRLGDLQLQQACRKGIQRVEAISLLQRMKTFQAGESIPRPTLPGMRTRRPPRPVKPVSNASRWVGRFLFFASVAAMPALLMRVGVSDVGVALGVIVTSLFMVYLSHQFER